MKKLDHLKVAGILGSEIGGPAAVTPGGVSVRRPRVGDIPEGVWKAVRDYAEACVADSRKGGTDPEDIPAIERRLRNARMNLLMVLTDHLK